MSDTPLTDDYVAALLSRDARFTQSSSTGFSTPTSGAPKHKPNTRFLRNILRDTDAHNAALLAKEEDDSRARLAALRRPKRRGEQAVWDVRARREQRRESSDGRRRHRDGERNTRAAEQSKDARERTSHRRERRERSRSRTRSRSPSRSPRRHKERRRHRTRSRSPRRQREERRRSVERGRESDSGSSSVLGPRQASRSPPVRSRGRGAAAAGSAMDKRFAEDYDPREDVSVEREGKGKGDDWDMALEAMRDRQRWRQTGADRLRAAGFTEDEVGKWEKGGNRDETDVRWAKKGEDREWDRGKKVE